METLDQWVTARSRLTEAATGFLDSCLALKKVAVQSSPSHPNQIILEGLINDVQPKMDSIDTVEGWMRESRAALNTLLNHSTSRVPANKLPPEILGRIFAVVVGSTPCRLEHPGRDTLLDIPLVCARWYQVATSTRSLWSHIDIYSRSKGADSNLVQMWLKRSHGRPLHIHVNSDPLQTGATITKLVSILQPYRASTSSFLFAGTNPNIAQALFALYLGDGGPGNIINTLAVSSVWNSWDNLPWPGYSSPRLTSLELCDLEAPACPALDELVTMLLNFPNLHTLRLAQLRNFSTRPGHQQNHRIISLPCLQLLEIAISGRSNALAVLLSMIHPGELELHIRLGINFIGDEPVPHAAQLLLARSNVVSLVLSRIGCDSAPDIKLFFLDVPRLRALRVDLSDRDVDAFLSALADCYVVEYLPSLRLLCLSNGEVNSRYMSRIKRMVEARRLPSLLFWSCRFPAFFNDQGGDAQHQVGFIDFGAIADADVDEVQPQPQPQPQAPPPAPAPAQDLDLDLDPDLDLDLNLGIDEFEDDDDDAGILGSESETPNTYSHIPTRTEEWLLGRVDRLVVCEAPLDRIINGVDVLAQEMAKIDSNDRM